MLFAMLGIIAEIMTYQFPLRDKRVGFGFWPREHPIGLYVSFSPLFRLFVYLGI
jgi:hypothetical protein